VLRCQCPLVTPASFGGNGCPHAIPTESIKIPHQAKITFFTTYSFLYREMYNEHATRSPTNSPKCNHSVDSLQAAIDVNLNALVYDLHESGIVMRFAYPFITIMEGFTAE
jgi:hypothetical protein